MEIQDVDPTTEGVAHEQLDIPVPEFNFGIDDADQVPVEQELEPEQTTEPEPEQTTEPEPEPEPEQAPKPKKKKKSYKERMNQILYEKHAANEEAAAAKAKAEIIRQEFEEYKAANTRPEATTADSTADELATLRQNRRQAAEDGDLPQAFDIDDKIRAAESRQRAVNAPKPQQQQQPQPQPQQQQYNPSTEAWLGDNEWYHDPQYKHLAGEVNQIENQLRDDGYGLGPALYKALDKRLAELPEFDAVYPVEEAPKPKPRPRPRVASPSAGGEPPVQRKTDQLTDYDIQVMRRTPGIDENNPQHRATYLKYKKA